MKTRIIGKSVGGGEKAPRSSRITVMRLSTLSPPIQRVRSEANKKPNVPVNTQGHRSSLGVTARIYPCSSAQHDRLPPQEQETRRPAPTALHKRSAVLTRRALRLGGRTQWPR